MFSRIKENAFLLLSIVVLSLLIVIALLSAIFILPFAIIVGAVFSIKQMLKWRKKQKGDHYTIGQYIFIKEPLSLKRVIQITFPKRGYKRAG